MSRDNQGSKWLRPKKRAAIYRRDGFECAYCGRGCLASDAPRFLCVDHYIPRELGGCNHAENLITACVSCNAKKGAMSPRKWWATLLGRGVERAWLKRRQARIYRCFRRALK